MIRGKLTKLQSNHTALRTNSIEGETESLPIVGQHFLIFGEPLTPEADTRVICTTPVTEVLLAANKDAYTFKTANSTYLFEVLP